MKWTVVIAGLLCLLSHSVSAKEEPSVPQTTLEKVYGCPEAFTRTPFEIELLFGGPGDVYNPFYSVFEPSRYINFRAWSSSAKIWEKDQYKAPHYMFYLPRQREDAAKALLTLDEFSWFKVTGIVLCLFETGVKLSKEVAANLEEFLGGFKDLIHVLPVFL